MAKRNDEVRRSRNARNDASVGSIEKDIETTYGLPPGCVSIRNSDGKNTRSDKKIGSLKKEHERNW